MMKLKENQEKKCHIGVSNTNPHAYQKLNVHGAERSTTETSRPSSRRYQRALYLVQYK